MGAANHSITVLCPGLPKTEIGGRLTTQRDGLLIGTGFAAPEATEVAEVW